MAGALFDPAVVVLHGPGVVLVGGGISRWHPVWSVVLGAYFLAVWDLVLDPAMAHPGLVLNF